ncbi:hypothetical protein Ddye_018841 [Dipteronia dyeriana]|uniref:Uncharacterized protein n=1 Tax=Dipteronia dyeriana TaxID=168575 RepID=A0AAD9TWU4_9ROSI|nr:hypothetical protein Ddye_018841 [Dipteronia dyeriana]
MVRAPCCEKMGLKRGPWTPEEDRILISYIHKHGHANWRALPKQAGLLRCGKSCRLRWINYLRPDIKRGNFTKEEEETIINLHEMLGNRWSAIAAKLPGRTDNEIKNVWHTHLKKRLIKQNQENSDTKKHSKSTIITKSESELTNPASNSLPMSPQQSSSDGSSVTAVTTGETNDHMKEENKGEHEVVDIDSFEISFPAIDESFWSDALSSDDNSSLSTLDLGRGMISNDIDQFQIDQSPFSSVDFMGYDYNAKSEHVGMDFWYNILLTTEGESMVPLF